jgi:hypothetical protein
MSEFYAHDKNYSSESDYDEEFDNNYPLTWELDHLTDVNHPDYNVDYVTPTRVVCRRPMPNIPKKNKKSKLWTDLKEQNKNRKGGREQPYSRPEAHSRAEPKTAGIQKKLEFKVVKKKID